MTGPDFLPVVAPWLAELSRPIPTAVKKLVTEIREEILAGRDEEFDEAAWRLTSDGKLEAFVEAYYGVSSSKDGLHRYSSKIGNETFPTSIYCKESWVPLKVNPSTLQPRVLESAEPAVLLDIEMIRYVLQLYKDQMRAGHREWNAPLYRLVSHGDGVLEQAFCTVSFSEYRLTNGLLTTEVLKALVATEGDISKIASRRTQTLRLRDLLLPDLSALARIETRLCCGGMGALFAVARPAPYNDFLIPLQRRSDQVTDTRGLLAVLPKAFHQPTVNSDAEANVKWTVLREVFEEVFGGSEVESESTALRHDRYMSTEPALNYFAEHEGAYTFEIVGFGLNALNGNYEFAALMAVPDVWYWRTFSSKMDSAWETEDVILLSSRDSAALADYLRESQWAPESRFHFTEALSRLGQLYPEKVSVPPISRVLAPNA